MLEKVFLVEEGNGIELKEKHVHQCKCKYFCIIVYLEGKSTRFYEYDLWINN